MPDLRDLLSRPLRDLRVSVTDHCNFRCPYCMPAEIFGPNFSFLPSEQILSLEELTQILRVFVSLGTEKLRLTGGEPLLRADLPELIRIAKQRLGVQEVTLTTNGWLLAQKASALKTAGLDRINVSLDSLDPQIFGKMNGRAFSPDRVVAGIRAAVTAGFSVKLNMVVQRGVNDHEIESMAEWARAERVTLRYIEFMDVGNHNAWKADQVVPAQEIVQRLQTRWPLRESGPNYRGEVARRYLYEDGGGEIGLISSVTEPFCRDCHRARISADGKFFTCLFASMGWDLRSVIRSGASDTQLFDFISKIWRGRADRYSDERVERLARGEQREKIEMSYIGG